VAFEAGDLNAEKFLAGNGVPNADVVEGAGGEEVGVASGEGNTVDTFVVASVTELGADLVSVAPVEGSLGGSGEEVSGISGESNAGHGAHDLGLRLDEHVLDVDFGDSTISGTSKEVTVVEKGEDVDALLEKTLGGANALVEAAFEVDFDDVSGEGTEVGGGVSGVNNNALELALNLTHVDILVADLLGDEVAGPNAKAVVVDCDELVVSGVEETDLVGDVHADGVSAESFAGFDLI